MARAADLLGLSPRQVRRLRRVYRTRGPAALVHGNRGRRSARRLADALRERVITLAKTIYTGVNHLHLKELLAARVESIRDDFRRFEYMVAWQTARRLAAAVHKLSQNDTFHRDFGLRDQIRRAAGSVMANIAEGLSHSSDREFARFLVVAKSSLNEVQSHLYIPLDQSYLDERGFGDLYVLDGNWLKRTGRPHLPPVRPEEEQYRLTPYHQLHVDREDLGDLVDTGNLKQTEQSKES